VPVDLSTVAEVVLALWVVAALVVVYMLDRATRHAPRDPRDGDGPALFIPDEWPEPWPHERDDVSTVRNPGLGK
jgi:hypothetical protein